MAGAWWTRRLYGGPDINLFPQAVIKRVDTVTGGASAAYGTDAVAGVVNFVLDTKFNGFKATLQGGQTSRGDNQNDEFSMTFGHNLGEHTHIILSGEHYGEDPVYTYKAATGIRAGDCCKARPPTPATASPIRGSIRPPT